MANERIWRLDESGAPTPLAEEPYDNEDALQELVADHPDVLEGITPDDPRRLLLIRREMGVREDAESSDRWSVDHLLVDQDARPTLVEVKRRANPEIRRRIVGQMLDYAAHARYWDLDAVRDHFEQTAGEEEEARKRVAGIIENAAQPDDDPYETFWEQFGENVQAERIRLLFVADDIPDDLATVVRFLGRHMADDIEVMAVEIKQFRSGSARTLVPRVVAGLERPVSRAAGSRTKHNRESLLAEFPEGADP